MSKRRLQYPGEICRPEERLIEKIERRIFEPIPRISVELSSLLELEKLLKPMGPPPQPRKGVVPDPLVPILVQEIKNKMYQNIDISTAVTVIDQPLGLRAMGLVADAMTILAIGGGFTYKMNKMSNDSTTAILGLRETDFEIEEVYITGLAPGTARIRINWNPDMIRLRP